MIPLANANVNNKYNNANGSEIAEQLSNVQKVRQLIKIVNTGNLENVENLIHEEYFNHESHIDVSSIQDLPENILQQIRMRNQLSGPAEFIDTVKSLRNAFTDLIYEEKEIHSDHNTVIAHYIVRGTHTGPFFAFPQTGRYFKYEAVHTHRFENGKIKEHNAIRGDLAFMLHLGLVVPLAQYESLFRLWKAVGDDGDDSNGEGARLE
jgi:nogalonic acid methyl ester cyclase / aklanonic acid methyl ester cyclase